MLFIALLLLFLPVTHAKPVDQDLQSWVSFMVQGPKTSPLRGYFEVQPRFGGDLSNTDRLILRPAVYYTLTPQISLWAGYAWQPIFEPGFVNENRIWQQVMHDDYFGAFRLVNRFRLEERFISSSVGDAAVRFRYSLRSLYPLSSDRSWSALVQNEVFLNITSVPRGPEAGFDQNRLFLGTNHKCTDLYSFDVGYLANFVHRPASSMDRFNHVLFINNYFNF
jgi:hypothetical protein